MDEMRTCRKCSQVKPLDQFVTASNCAGGKSYACKECGKAKSLAYRAAKLAADAEHTHFMESVRARVHSAKKFATKYGVEVNDFTVKDWLELLVEFDNKCFYCGGTQPRMWIEHVVPLSAGGPNTKDNVRPACEPCNRHKSIIPMEHFLANRCSKGHDQTEENIYRYPNGKTRCQVCWRAWYQANKQRKRMEKVSGEAA